MSIFQIWTQSAKNFAKFSWNKCFKYHIGTKTALDWSKKLLIFIFSTVYVNKGYCFGIVAEVSKSTISLVDNSPLIPTKLHRFFGRNSYSSHPKFNHVRNTKTVIPRLPPLDVNFIVWNYAPRHPLPLLSRQSLYHGCVKGPPGRGWDFKLAWSGD